MVTVPVKKIARIVGEALQDADRARRDASDPSFGQEVQRDRRGTLSRYGTVKHALRDRERIEKARAATGTMSGKSVKAEAKPPVKASPTKAGAARPAAAKGDKVRR